MCNNCKMGFNLIEPKGFIAEERVSKLGTVVHNDTIIAGLAVVRDSAVKVKVRLNDVGNDLELEYVKVPIYCLRVQLLDKQTFKVIDTSEFMVGSTRISLEKVWNKIVKYEVSFYHIGNIIEDTIMSEDELDSMAQKLIMDGVKRGLRYTKGVSLKSTFDGKNIQILEAQRVLA